MRTGIGVAISTMATAVIVVSTATMGHAYSAWEVDYGQNPGMTLGDCSDKQEIIVDYGKGCFRKTGDWFITRDTKADGKDVGIRWWNESSQRRGICRGHGGYRILGQIDKSCNKNLPEQTTVKYRVVRNDPANDPNKAKNWVDGTVPLTVLNDAG